jgi:DNA-binding transcriptional ArsR family regulator
MESFIRQAKAIADPTRARMLKLLEARELCVCDIMDIMGLGQSTASKHLGILKTAGLLESRKDGTWAYYRLSDKVRADNRDFLAFMAAHINDDARIQKDKRLLAGRKPGSCKK